MDILPNQANEFSTKDYWEKFFKHKKGTFEWYADYCVLSNVIEHYLKVDDKILQVGCGSSALAENLYDNGFRNVESIDTDVGVIISQARKNVISRPELIFTEQSATDIKKDDSSINIVIDKGTLDALYPPEFDESHTKLVEDMFNEIQRVLKPNGKYIIITLLQDHILKKIISHFQKTNQYSIRIHCSDGGEVSDFPLPVFIIVITKFKLPMPMPLPVEYMNNSTMKAVRKLSNLAEIIDVINGEREFNMFATYKTKNFSEQSSLKLYDSNNKERFCLLVVDDKNVKEVNSMAAYIVSLDEGGNYLYTTNKGREIIRKSCNVNRLLMFYLYPDQVYGTKEEIQNEVSDFVRRLTPVTLKGKKINFLAIQDPTVVLKEVRKGKSKINGEWKVVDVNCNNDTSRRLIFTNCPNLIQSEAYIYKEKNGSKYKLDMKRLNSQYHYSFLLSLAMVDSSIFLNRKTIELRLLVLGVGGGLFSTFLHDFFPKSTIIGVELDSSVIDIAKNCFKFPTDERMIVHIDDGMSFVSKESSLDKKYDGIFIDIAGSSNFETINCPPPQFFNEEVLKDIKNCLTTNGVLSINVVTRDDEMHETIRWRIRQIFPKLYHTTCEDDINQVIICPKNSIYINQSKYPSNNIFKDVEFNSFTDCESSLKHELSKMKSLT
uniref:Methyltransf_11 domain-containing protein n=1 Tax=Parastrongyloides trichosuri TaxID=131310 RepID=A0A0N4Z748_PARTI